MGSWQALQCAESAYYSMCVEADQTQILTLSRLRLAERQVNLVYWLTIKFLVLCFYLIDLFIYLFGMQSYRENEGTEVETEIFIHWFTPQKTIMMTRVGQAEGRHTECHLGLPLWWQVPKHLKHF